MLRARHFQLLAFCSALPSVALAQDARGSLTVGAGSATDVRGVVSRAVTVTPAITLTPSPLASFVLSGSGTRFDTQAWALSLDGSGALRAPIGRYSALTLNGGADAVRTSYGISYETLQAVPALKVGTSGLSGFVGATGALATSRALVDATVPANDLFGAPSTAARTINASRTARGIVFGASARTVTADGETVAAGLREEHARIDTIPTIDRSLSLALSQGRVTLSGVLGVRAEPDVRTAFGSAGLSIAMTSLASLEVAAGSYPSNRLVATPGGRYVNVGLSLHAGSATPHPAVEPSATPKVRDGLTRLALRADDATTVEVAGDFTNWKPIATHRAPNGVWFVDLLVPPGQYRYAFRVNGSAWRVPDGVATVDDDLGGKSAWLVVSAPNPAAR